MPDPQTVDKVRDNSLALSIYKGNHRLPPIPFLFVRKCPQTLASPLFF